MSNFTAIAIHPLTKAQELAQYIDNGAAGYSVKFSDGYTYLDKNVTQVIECKEVLNVDMAGIEADLKSGGAQ